MRSFSQQYVKAVLRVLPFRDVPCNYRDTFDFSARAFNRCHAEGYVDGPSILCDADGVELRDLFLGNER